MNELMDNIAYAAKAGTTESRSVVSTWGWATVTQSSPLRIRYDGEAEELDVTPDTLTGGLLPGQRVWVQLAGRRLIVHGSASQPIVQAGSVLVTATGGLGTAPVTFPITFPGTPIITVSGQSGVAALANVQFDTPTSNGFTMVMQRSSTQETTCTWIAVWTPIP